MGDARSVSVVNDPSGEYSNKAMFSVLDLMWTIRLNGWPEGIEFRISPRGCEPFCAKMVDGELIHEDGRYMCTSASRGYKWVEVER